MIELPKSLLSKRFDTELTRGRILRTSFVFQNEQHYKRLVLLNNNFQMDDIYFVFTTTKTSWYKMHSDIDWIRKHFIYVPKGITAFNIDEDMIIDCRKVNHIKKNKLLENWVVKKLDFIGMLPQDLMNNIEQLFKESKLISSKIKQHILLKD